MASDPNPVRLQTTDRDRIQALTVRLEEAWRATGSRVEPVSLDPFLPPASDPLRVPILCELIRVDLEMRCRRRRSVGLEHYLKQFPELGTPASVSPELIRDEY